MTDSQAPTPEAPAPADLTPTALRVRHDGWTPAKQLAFIEALAETACVAEACAAVGMSRASAYALRMKPHAQAFRVAWEAALDLGVRRLSDEVMARAVNGVVVPHFYKGEQVGEHRRYDERLAMWLLRYRDPLRYAATLDQMVYSGHPEQAALAFAKAHNMLSDAAHHFTPPPEDEGDPEDDAFDPEEDEYDPEADEFEPEDDQETGAPPPPIGARPWQATPLAEERQRQADAALATSGAPIHGTFERRHRFAEMRRRLDGSAAGWGGYDP